jgi:hypothetical protein
MAAVLLFLRIKPSKKLRRGKSQEGAARRGIRWVYVDHFNKSSAGAPTERAKSLEILQKNLAREVS